MLRTSYTTLKLWHEGNWEEAIKSHYKLDRIVTQQMEDGRTLHKEWELEILNTGCMPKVFGGAKLNDPECELKLEVKLTDWLTIVGVIDLIDGDIINELKSGVASADSYARGYQLGTYGVLAILSGRKVRQGRVYRYNQYDGSVEVSVRWLTKAYLKQTLAWLETVASEMYNYIEENGLDAKLGKK